MTKPKTLEERVSALENPEPKFKSMFSNNLGIDQRVQKILQQKLDLLEKRVKLLETDNKKLNEKLKKLLE